MQVEDHAVVVVEGGFHCPAVGIEIVHTVDTVDLSKIAVPLLTPRGTVQALTNSNNSSNYSYNFRVRVAEVTQPSRTLLVVDSDSAVASLAERHSGRGNCLFVDGHVSPHTAAEASALKTSANK